MQSMCLIVFFFQAEDGIRDVAVTGVQTCALPISNPQSLLQAAQSGGQTHEGGAHRVRAETADDPQRDGAGPVTLDVQRSIQLLTARALSAGANFRGPKPRKPRQKNLPARERHFSPPLGAPP